MIRVRMAAIAAVISLAFVAVAAPVAGAANGTGSQFQAYNFPALYTVAVKGATKDGKTFNGSLAIQRFVAKHGKAWADGTLKGTINGHHVIRYGVMMPASLTGGASSSRAHTAANCPVLNLVIGPISLNLLGLQVNLGGGAAGNQPIVLNITANSNGGLLGQLLCGLSNALGSGGLAALQNDLTSLVSSLNGILGLLSGLPAGL